MNWNAIPDDQPTPSLIISADIARKNILSMQEYCDRNSLKLRPHTKTHKSIHMAKEQIAAGAVGLVAEGVGGLEAGIGVDFAAAGGGGEAGLGGACDDGALGLAGREESGSGEGCHGGEEAHGGVISGVAGAIL